MDALQLVRHYFERTMSGHVWPRGITCTADYSDRSIACLTGTTSVHLSSPHRCETSRVRDACAVLQPTDAWPIAIHTKGGVWPSESKVPLQDCADVRLAGNSLAPRSPMR